MEVHFIVPYWIWPALIGFLIGCIIHDIFVTPRQR